MAGFMLSFGGRAGGASRVRPCITERILRTNGFDPKTFQQGAAGRAPGEFIVRNMDCRISTRAYVVAWLLCVVLTGLAIHSSHCDRCDRQYLRASSVPQHPLANHQLPTEPDACNGICWCCGFHGLPNAAPVLTLANYVTFDVWLEPVSVVLAPRSTIFRPPRTAIS